MTELSTIEIMMTNCIAKEPRFNPSIDNITTTYLEATNVMICPI